MIKLFQSKDCEADFFSCFAGEWKVFSFYFFVASFFNQDLKLYSFTRQHIHGKWLRKKKLEKREETNLEMALLNPSSLLMPILFHLSHSHAIIKMRKSTEMANFFLCGESEKNKWKLFLSYFFFKGKWKRTNLLTIAIQGK